MKGSTGGVSQDSEVVFGGWRKVSVQVRSLVG